VCLTGNFDIMKLCIYISERRKIRVQYYTNSKILTNLWYNLIMRVVKYDKLIKGPKEELEELLKKERDIRIYIM